MTARPPRAPHHRQPHTAGRAAPGDRNAPPQGPTGPVHHDM
ncbi:hypothetical protein [Streptomyces decoyicus]